MCRGFDWKTNRPDLESSTVVTHTGCPSTWDILDFFKAWRLGSKVPIPQEKVRERGTSRARQKLCYHLSPSLRSHAVSRLLYSVGAVTNSRSDSRAHHSVEGVAKSHREKRMWNERYWWPKQCWVEKKEVQGISRLLTKLQYNTASYLISRLTKLPYVTQCRTDLRIHKCINRREYTVQK